MRDTNASLLFTSSFYLFIYIIRFFLPSQSGNFLLPCNLLDRLCGLVVRVLGYRSGGPGSIPGTARKKSSGFGKGSLSLVSTTEELLDRKVVAPV
jgi:hypothetical protein